MLYGLFYGNGASCLRSLRPPLGKMSYVSQFGDTGVLFCGLAIFFLFAGTIFAVRVDGNFCWELIFAILCSITCTTV